MMFQSGTYTYVFLGDEQVDITVALDQGYKLDVNIFVGRSYSYPVVRHLLGLGNSCVRVIDIYGAGSNTRWHRQGLGALAVNTAIQFLKDIYPLTATLRGHVYDAKGFDLPEEERLLRQKDRKAFWRVFGYGITTPDSRGNEFLCGTIGDLKVLATGHVLGVHPRLFNIEEMHFHTGYLSVP